VSDDWVTIALLGKPRGNRGEVTAVSLTSKPERFQSLERVFLSGRDQAYAIEEIWEHKGALIFKFSGVGSISEAEALHGCEVRVPMAERARLEEGEYFDSDLIGCEVIDLATGRALGKVTAMQDPGLVEIEGNLLIPFARELCVSIDVANKRIEVRLPEGLLEVNPS
jgi:16S rRNA processing protein RimM